jgi:membrane protease YdiL (CAAX protease family)
VTDRVRALVRGRTPDVVYLALCVLACIAIAARGDAGDALQGVGALIVLVPLAGVMRGFTDPAVRGSAPPHRIVATVLVGTLFVVTTIEVAYHPPGGIVGAWSSFHWGIATDVAHAIRVLDDESVNSTLVFVVLPVALLAAIGWRRRDLGFGPSRRGATRALAFWCAIPLALYAAALALGHATLTALGHRFFIDLFRNGYAEEILFRGIVLRLTVAAFGLSLGNVVQAVLFGIFHLGADLRDVHGDTVLALLDGFATQGLFGYVMGLIALRTGNVFVAGAVHALVDVAAILH